MNKLFLALCLLAISAPGFAQTSAGVGAISGVVTDQTGATVEGATVVIDNAELGIHRELHTTGGGLFNAPSLVPNTGYYVKVNAAGFEPFENRNITVHVGQNVSIQVHMSLQSATTQVEVTDEAPIVDQVKTDVSQVIDESQSITCRSTAAG